MVQLFYSEKEIEAAWGAYAAAMQQCSNCARASGSAIDRVNVPAGLSPGSSPEVLAAWRTLSQHMESVAAGAKQLEAASLAIRKMIDNQVLTAEIAAVAPVC